MPPTPEAFDQIADFCERHLEGTYGREIGMTFGAAVLALGRLAAATSSSGTANHPQLNERAQNLLFRFAIRYCAAHNQKCCTRMRLAEPLSTRNNMIYDSRRRGE